MTPEELFMLADVEAPSNPFPGLRPFEFGESHLYFGRDGQSDQLIRKLAATRFVAVVGTSGSGKSSLVRAGLLPDLFSGYMSSAGSHWRIALMRPSNDPLGNLALALNATNVFGSDIAENAQIQTVITEATLRRGSLGLVEAVRQNRMPSNESLLIVVDQFEELFRFARVSGSEQYRFEAAAFVKLLLEAARQREHAIYVVLTMRSDFLGDCSLFWDLPEAINEGQYLIPRLTRDQRAEAITGPIAVCGGQISDRLVNRLLNDTGDNPDLLPILQHALMRTWEKWAEDHSEGEPVDLRHYEAIGTMSDALSRHADEAWSELPDERSRQIAEKIFKALTEKGEDNREVRRPTELRELCALTGAKLSEVVPVIDVFRREGRSFLMPPASVLLDEESLIDISHESLIRNWQRLKEWVDEESLSAQIYGRLAETAVLYEKEQAGLWRDPDLQLALDWRERSTPSAAWAMRYHPAFDSAMAFLDASVAAREAAAREEERRRRREIKRARVTAVIFFFLFMLSLVAFAYAYNKTIQAQESLAQVKEANELANNALAQTQKERDRANEQSDRANQQSELARYKEQVAREAGEKALEKKKEAEESKAEAERQAEIARRNEHQATAAKAESDKQSAIAKAETKRNLQLLYTADINLAQQAYEATNIGRGRSLLDEFLLDVSKEEKPGFEWFYLWNLYHREAATIEGSQKGIKSIAYSPDGKAFASADADGTIKLWDASSKAEIATLPGHTKAVSGLAFSPDGNMMASVSRDKTIRLWDVASPQKQMPQFPVQEREVSCVAFSPDGLILATGGRDGALHLWDVKTAAPIKSVIRHNSTVNALAFSPKDKLIATGSADGTAKILNYASGDLIEPQNLNVSGSVLSVAFSPDGQLLATGSSDGKMKLWYVATHQLAFELEGHVGAINSLKFSPDGKLLAGGGRDKALTIWPLRPLTERSTRAEIMTPAEIRSNLETEHITLKGHTNDVWSIAFSPDNRLLASSDEDGKIKLWNIDARMSEQFPLINRIAVKSIAVSPDGKLIAAAVGLHVKLWDATTHELLTTFKDTGGFVGSVAFSPDSRVLASSGSMSTAFLDVTSYQQIHPALVGHGDINTAVAFSPDGKLIATAGRDKTVRLWDAVTHQALKTFDGYSNPVLCVAFSRDGKMLATGSGDGTIIIWDVVKRTEQFRSNVHKAAVNSVAFSPDGKRFATASDDLTVRVWDAKTFEELAELADHADKVRAVAFSPDSRTLASGGDDMDVMLWDMHLFKRLLTLKGHTNAVSSLAFSQDGQLLFTAGFDETVRTWRAASIKDVLAGR